MKSDCGVNWGQYKGALVQLLEGVRKDGRERQNWSGEQRGVCWIVGIQAHKQAIDMLQVLLKPSDQIWIIPVPGHRSWDRASLVERNKSWDQQMHHCADVEAVLETIRALGPWPDPFPVLAGSLYLIGDLFSRGLVTAE